MAAIGTRWNTLWLAAMLLSGVMVARSVSKPPETQRSTLPIWVYVTVAVTTELETGFYVYRYSLTNDFESQNSLEAFAVTPASAVREMRTPAHWTAFRDYQGDSASVVWRVTDNVDYWPPGWDGISVAESPYNPWPGQTTSGFVIKSAHPPGEIAYYAEGFEPIPDESLQADEFFRLPTIFESKVTGSTLGPRTLHSLVGARPPSPTSIEGHVQIGFTLPRSARVSLAIQDSSGGTVRRLVEGWCERGLHTRVWDMTNDRGQRLSRGAYFSVLRVADRTIARQPVVIGE